MRTVTPMAVEPTLPGTAMSLDDLVQHIEREGAHHVNAGEWHPDWATRWVAFADLIGFASVARNSRDTVLNMTVRFHRAVTAVQRQYSALRFLRFTDATYIAGSEASELLKACADLQHYCLALNLIRLRRPAPAWVHMIVPRITVARGALMSPPDPLPQEARYLGVHPESFLIGDGIVNAYNVEKGSAGSMISVASGDADDFREQAIRGTNGWPRTVLRNWVDGCDLLQHDGVVDVPWLVLRARQPPGMELWATDAASMATKIETLRSQWKYMFKDFVYQAQPGSVGKHYMLVQRHLISLYDMRDGRRPRSIRTIEWLENDVN
jgi:hypothetical protein